MIRVTIEDTSDGQHDVMELENGDMGSAIIVMGALRESKGMRVQGVQFGGARVLLFAVAKTIDALDAGIKEALFAAIDVARATGAPLARLVGISKPGAHACNGADCGVHGICTRGERV